MSQKHEIDPAKRVLLEDLQKAYQDKPRSVVRATAYADALRAYVEYLQANGGAPAGLVRLLTYYARNQGRTE